MRVTVGSFKEYLDSYNDDAILLFAEGDRENEPGEHEFGFFHVYGDVVVVHSYVPKEWHEGPYRN